MNLYFVKQILEVILFHDKEILINFFKANKIITTLFHTTKLNIFVLDKYYKFNIERNNKNESTNISKTNLSQL